MTLFSVSRSVLLLSSTLTLFACGGGGGSSSGAPAAPLDASEQGFFIDGPVSGVEYSYQSGSWLRTAPDGGFQYPPGARLNFRIGGVELGESDAAGVVTPDDLAAGNDSASLNITRFLLTLDADGDPANGLQISDEVLAFSQNQNISANAFAVSAADFANSSLADIARQANGDGTRPLKSEADAQAERACREQDMQDGRFDGDCERLEPVVDAGPDASDFEGAALILHGAATAKGERSIQRLAWRQLTGPTAMVDGASDQNVLRIVLPQVETDAALEFELLAVDSGGLSASDRVLVSVLDQFANALPEVNAGDDLSVTAGDRVELMAQASDPDGRIVSVRWRFEDEEADHVIDNADQLNASLTAPNVADTRWFKLIFEATDDDGGVASDDLMLEVAAKIHNEAPVIESLQADPGVVYSGEQLDLLSEVFDAEGDALSFDWYQADNGAPLVPISDANNANAQLNIPELESETPFEFVLSVSDGANTVLQSVLARAYPSSKPAPTPQECLTQPVQRGCPLWLFHDALAADDFSACESDPTNASCPLSLILDLDPGLEACFLSPSLGECQIALGKLTDPSFLLERLPPEQSTMSCNPAYDARSFEPYAGVWHEHTAYSDGTWGQRPIDMYQQVKQRGFDFAVSTEHSDTLNPGNAAAVPRNCESDNPVECQIADLEQPENNVRKWAAIAEMAEASSDADFTAIRGFEWTSDRFGHINVVFSDKVINAKTGPGYAVSMSRFWQWLAYPRALGGGDDALISFNHPGREDAIEGILHDEIQGSFEDHIHELPVDLHDPAYTFNDFRYVPAADYRSVGVEVFGKGSEYDSGGKGGSWLSYALDQGWHLGPIGSEDHHGTDWGGESLPKTVVIARSKAQDDIKEALLARRFYAVAQHYNDLRIDVSIAGNTMGSRLRRPAGTQLDYQVQLSRNGVPWAGRVEWVSAGNSVVASQEGSELSVNLSVTDDTRYYFLRVYDPQTNRPVLFTAPVWLVPGQEPLPACLK